MLKGVKKFIKQRFMNESHPFMRRMLQEIQLRRFARAIAREQENHSRKTYAEIEAEISRHYRKVFGRTLNWDNPQTYNEKIHVSKVYMSSPLKTRLADKVAVRKWITEKIGSEYLIPLLGVYDSFDEIDFDALPASFVIKCSHDSGSVTLVKDKSKIDRACLRRKYALHMSHNWAWMGWEMHYRDIVPKIMIEQYMGDTINDYKFMCFDGKPFCCWVDLDRFTNHTRNFYDLNWHRLNIALNLNYPNSPKDARCPDSFDEMKRITEVLCDGFPHVRVDLYCVNSKTYFGELTFASGNGFENFTPDEWDYKLGALWPFDVSVRRQVLAHSSRP